MSDMRGRAPGWYPDERYPEDERWWDGKAWSTGTRPAGEHAARSRSALDAAEDGADQRSRGLVLLLGSVGFAILLGLMIFFGR